MIGEIGALGGGLLPNAMGLSKQYTGSFAVGFVAYAVIAAVVLGCLFVWQRKWVGTWVGPRGKVLDPAAGTLAPQGRLEPATV